MKVSKIVVFASLTSLNDVLVAKPITFVLLFLLICVLEHNLEEKSEATRGGGAKMNFLVVLQSSSRFALYISYRLSGHLIVFLCQVWQTVF